MNEILGFLPFFYLSFFEASKFPQFKFKNLNMMQTLGSTRSQGCDNSPPLNKNLVPRFKRRVRRRENATSIIFTIQGALQLNVDSFTIIVLMSCSEKSCQHGMEGRRRLQKGRSSRRSNNSGLTHGMRHRTISRVETRYTHQEGWKETDDEGSLGGQ